MPSSSWTGSSIGCGVMPLKPDSPPRLTMQAKKGKGPGCKARHAGRRFGKGCASLDAPCPKTPAGQFTMGQVVPDGEPGVVDAWLELDSAQARRAILSPFALCSICGNGFGGTPQDSKPSPPAMGAGRRSVHRLLDSKRSSAFPRGHFLLVGGCGGCRSPRSASRVRPHLRRIPAPRLATEANATVALFRTSASRGYCPLPFCRSAMETIPWHPPVCPDHHRPDLVLASAEPSDSQRNGSGGSVARIGISCLRGARSISRASRRHVSSRRPGDSGATCGTEPEFRCIVGSDRPGRIAATPRICLDPLWILRLEVEGIWDANT